MLKCQNNKRTNKILFIQNGDYKEAFNRLKQGGEENYFAQKFTVEYVANLAKYANYIGILSNSEEPYAEQISDGLYAFGTNIWNIEDSALYSLLKEFNPTHIILRIPLIPVFNWCTKNKVKLLPLFSENFNLINNKNEDNQSIFKSLLNHESIKWIANHNIPAALSLKKLGVDTKKIIAYDYDGIWNMNPTASTVKELSTSRRIFHLIFIGALMEEKGLKECIVALKLLRENNINSYLTIAGKGDISNFEELWNSLHLSHYIKFLGEIPNKSVIPLLHSHDVVIIPSRHSYPEGLPLILYEAICSRTPIVISDHPMFISKIKDEKSGLVFRAEDATHLALQIEKLLENKKLYNKLSREAVQTWENLKGPVKWSELLTRFLRSLDEDMVWLNNNTLAATLT